MTFTPSFQIIGVRWVGWSIIRRKRADGEWDGAYEYGWTEGAEEYGIAYCLLKRFTGLGTSSIDRGRKIQRCIGIGISPMKVIHVCYICCDERTRFLSSIQRERIQSSLLKANNVLALSVKPCESFFLLKSCTIHFSQYSTQIRFNRIITC